MAKLPGFFGLDIGSSALKLVQSSQGGSPTLLSIFSSQIENTILKDESEVGRKKLSESIKTIVENSKIKTKNCIIAMPEDKVFSRLLTLPRIKDEEANEAIPWALRSLIPVPLEDVSISFIQVNEYKKEDSVLQDWYTVAAPLSVIDSYQTLIKNAGLNLLAIETEVMAISRIVHQNTSQNSDVLIVEIGYDTTNIILSKQSGPFFSQTTSTAGNSFTKVVAADFGIDLTQAEQYKINFGMDFQKGEGKIANSIKPLLDLILEEISRTIGYYKNKLNGNSIEKIVLTGGVALMPGLSEYIKKQLLIETEVTNLFDKFKMNNVRREAEQNINKPSFAVALGLSLKGSTNF